MSSQAYFFFLPPGCLTSFELLSIHVVSAEEHTLAVRHDGNVYEVEKAQRRGDETVWSVNDFSEFADLRASSFEVVLDGEVFHVSFDSLVLVSVDEALSQSEAPRDVLLFRFVAGYFARACDFRMGKLVVNGVRVLRASRREAFQKAVVQCHQGIEQSDEAFDSKFSSVYERVRERDEERRRMAVERFEAYESSVAASPKMSTSYCAEVVLADEGKGSLVPQLGFTGNETPIRDTGRRTSLRTPRMNSTKAVPANLARSRSPVEMEPEPESMFPLERSGWRAPSSAEIRVCLEELAQLFPIDEARKKFCNIKEDDQDLNAQKMFLFDVVHFMTLVAQFTGIVFDYRIKLVEGCYRFEERLTGNEVKRDLNGKNIQTSPYRAAVFACLKKIVREFKLSVSSQTMVGHISAIMKLPSLLPREEEVDPYECL